MADDSPELPLQGGRVTAGVVRVGQTARRPPGPTSDFVGRLLRHLELAEFEGAPRFLGMDEQGHDVLSYIEGEVLSDLSWHDDAVLMETANLIRRYHDATASLLASPAASAVGLEVVCHNDLSPCNFVFRSGRPVAIIDFDAAAPGARALDLGYAAWLWLDLGTPEIPPAEQWRRLTLFVTAYGAGGPSLEVVVEAVWTRQSVLIMKGERRGDRVLADWARACLGWTMEQFRRV